MFIIAIGHIEINKECVSQDCKRQKKDSSDNRPCKKNGFK